jgi:hypothetical protein
LRYADEPVADNALGDFGNVDAVDCDCAFGDLDKFEERREQRALSTASAPNDADFLAFANIESYALQCLRPIPGYQLAPCCRNRPLTYSNVTSTSDN